MRQKSIRQSNAASRLEAQLLAGNKTAKKSGTKVPLTEGDKNRITKELDILKKNK